MTCADCIHFSFNVSADANEAPEKDAGRSTGTCRRYPPRWIGEDAPMSVFPSVHRRQGCGEYQGQSLC